MPRPFRPHEKPDRADGDVIINEVLRESVGRVADFGKYMATLSFSAIAVYISILKFVYPQAGTATDLQAVVQIVPALVFLASALAFIYAIIPASAYYNANDESDRLSYVRWYNRTSITRLRVAQLGSLLFTAGVTIGIAQVFGQGWTWAVGIAILIVAIAAIALAWREWNAPRPTEGVVAPAIAYVAAAAPGESVPEEPRS